MSGPKNECTFFYKINNKQKIIKNIKIFITIISIFKKVDNVTVFYWYNITLIISHTRTPSVSWSNRVILKLVFPNILINFQTGTCSYFFKKDQEKHHEIILLGSLHKKNT